MKKLIIVLISICFVFAPLSASLVPFNDYYFDKDDIFSSPALLLEAEKTVVHFGFDIEAMSAIDYLSYLADPSSSLAEASDYLYDTLMNGDVSFWSKNSNILSTIFDFDLANIPSLGTGGIDSSTIEEIRLYLEDSYARRFNKDQKASAVIKAINNTNIFKSSSAPELNGALDLTLKMHGGVIEGNGFGWRVKSNIGLSGSGNMLSSSSSILGLDVRGDVGYAFHFLNEKITIGTSLEAGLYANNIINNPALLDARFSGALAIQNPFRLGMGVSLNAGVMYRHSDNLAFAMDFTNLVSFRKYAIMELTDFVNFNGLDMDENVYYEPLDIIVRVRWDYGKYHVVAEMGDIVRQLIWMNERDNMTFDFFAVPKAYFIYDINEDLNINTGLEYSGILFGVEYLGLKGEISFSFKDLSIGIKAGYRF